MSSKKGRNLPASSAGLLTFFDNDTEGIQISPTIVVILGIAVVVFGVAVNVFL